MIQRTPVLLALALAVGTAPAQAPDDLAAKIIEEGLDHSQAMVLLDELTNGVGQRLTGSDNFRKAAEWARARFQAMGLEARLEQWGEWKTGWNRGQWSGRVVSPVPMELFFATAAWTAGTKGVVRGRLLAMPADEAELAALGDAVRGAWLFDVQSIPDYEAPRQGAQSAGGPPVWLRDRAAELGIGGFIASSVGTAEYPDRIRVFSGRGQPWLSTDRPTVPDVVLRRDQAIQLRWMLAHCGEVTVEFDIRNRFTAGPIPLHNVIADLPGTEKPHEYVVVCGHLDSWHQATGTTDNGTGATSTMEAARILAAVGARPKRTIRFCLWGGEEQGLLGSHEYVVQHRQEMDGVSCVLNHDTGTNWAHALTVTEQMFPLMEKVMAPVMTLHAPESDYDGPVFELRKTAQLRAGGGSDHASFQAAGVPGLNWSLEGRSDYFNHTWHTQWDTFDQAIPEYQRHTATVIALTALGVANLPELLPREGVERTGGRGGDATVYLSDRLGVAVDGVEFKTIQDGGLAAAAGIQAGDPLVAANGKPVEKLADVFTVLRDSGDFRGEVELTLQRGEQQVKIKVAPFAGRGGRGGRRGDG